MGFFSELEGNLEKYIEGFFKDKFGSTSIQPLEIARMLAREMRDRRRVGLKDIFVPNRFEVYLSEEDFKAIEPLINRLSTELRDYVTGKTKEKNFALLSPIEIKFIKDKLLPKGKIRVQSSFDNAIQEKMPESLAMDDTLRYTPVRVNHHEVLNSPRTAKLNVVEGALEGKKFILSNNQTLIGRGGICNICISESSVSRRHAVITCADDSFMIHDQNSTNGTFVNGVKVTQKVLKNGDIIKIGKTVLAFKVE